MEDNPEHYIRSAAAVRRPEYVRLGLTDATILELLASDPKAILLTADHNLHLAALWQELKAVNFNYFRDERPDFR